MFKMLKNRSVALVIILSLVTCGIYGLYWIYVTAEALENNGRAGNGAASADHPGVFIMGGHAGVRR